MIAYGRNFIANPDLVARFTHHQPLSQAHRETFYTGGAKGYIDYPEYAVAGVQVASATAVQPGEKFSETRAKLRNQG